MQYQFFPMKAILREVKRVFDEPYLINERDGGVIREELMRVYEGDAEGHTRSGGYHDIDPTIELPSLGCCIRHERPLGTVALDFDTIEGDAVLAEVSHH
jgi:hypothetical protein